MARHRLSLIVLAIGLLVLGATWFLGLGGSDANLLAIPFLIAPFFLETGSNERGVGRLDHAGPVLLLGNVPPPAFYSVLSLLFGFCWALVYIHMGKGFLLSTWDIGIYSNVAWNSSQGHLMYSSFLGRNDLGEHFSPVLLLFAPLYALTPSLGWLLGAQLLAYLSAPPLLYWILQPGTDPRARAQAYLIGVLWYLYLPMASAMFFPFHPSSLGVPFLLIAFGLMRRKAWIPMAIVLLFSLTLKENLTLAMAGFGLYLVLRRDTRWIGVCFLVGGLVSACLITGWVLPGFRGENWAGHLSRVGPTDDPVPKALYLLKLLAPLGCVPLIRWRSGVIALPAILLNLATRFPEQYSAQFQYDDVTAPLLFLATADALRRESRHPTPSAPAGWVRSAVYGLWVAAIIVCVPVSPLRYIRKHSLAHVPWEQGHVQLQRLDRAYPDRMLHVQSHLGPHLHRLSVRVLLTCHGSLVQQRFAKGELLVLAPHLNSWGIENFEKEQAELEKSTRFRSIPGYSPLVVYETLLSIR